MMAFVWTRAPERAWPEMSNAYVQLVRAALQNLALYYAPLIEAWMKQNAVWTDRTGNARQSLNVEVERFLYDVLEIVLAHGVNYGWSLELDYAGRYAIIGPALDYWTPRIWRDVVAIMRST